VSTGDNGLKQWRRYAIFGYLKKLRIQALVAHTCKSKLLKRQRSGGSRFEISPGQIVCKTLYRKEPITKKVGRGLALWLKW
jgi:hypothetical protein